MNKTVVTLCGEVVGALSENGVVSFKGIRYATAKRWEYPQLVTKWQGVYNAESYGSCSYQPRAFYNEEENPGKIFYYNEFRKGENYIYDEDCLFLNVFTSESADENSKLPVIVYIHGGGFTGGCAHEKHFDGPVWAKKGVVAVTVNYRLGPMGFACLGELEAEAGHTGNYGLFDQIAAIKWVKQNISAFGGDSDNITIMGQSAGAMSVWHLCRTELTKGLFTRAVMSSGVGMGSMLLGKTEKCKTFWAQVMKMCGANTLEEFRNVPAKVLFEQWKKAQKEVKGGAMACFPVIDDVLIKKSAQMHKLSYMVGSASHDTAPAILYALTKKWAIENEAFMWHFERNLPGDDKGAWHSSDLWYWFGTLKNCWRPMTDRDYALSDEMTSYLCNFAKSGNPNASHLPLWEICKDAGSVMCFGDNGTKAGKVNMKKLIVTTLTTKPVGE